MDCLGHYTCGSTYIFSSLKIKASKLSFLYQAHADLKIHSGDLPVALQATESLAMFDKYMSQLPIWNLAFEKFMVSKSKDLTSREVQGAALLKIHYTTAKIMASVRPDISDMRRELCSKQ